MSFLSLHCNYIYTTLQLITVMNLASQKDSIVVEMDALAFSASQHDKKQLLQKMH